MCLLVCIVLYKYHRGRRRAYIHTYICMMVNLCEREMAQRTVCTDTCNVNTTPLLTSLRLQVVLSRSLSQFPLNFAMS